MYLSELIAKEIVITIDNDFANVFNVNVLHENAYLRAYRQKLIILNNSCKPI